MMNIRKLLRIRKDNTPVVPAPVHVVSIPMHTPVRQALPTDAWFDAR